jgi:hypothetical protein
MKSFVDPLMRNGLDLLKCVSDRKCSITHELAVSGKEAISLIRANGVD